MLFKGLKQILFKTIIFLIAFITISFIIGKRIVSSKLLYGFDIFIYGGMGYVLLFSIAGFVLLYKERLSQLKEYKYKFSDFVLVMVSIFLAVMFYILELNISKIEINLLNIFLIHLFFLSIFFFLAIGIFSLASIKEIIRNFKKELFYFLIFGIVAYALMAFVWQFWPYLSAIVLKITYFLLDFLGVDVQIVNNDMLRVKTFVVKIGEACSGIYSIFLFSALYIFIILLDRKKLNKTKASLIFAPALLGAFFVNVLRVFSLMLIGGYISREIALGLYHSYVGMIFFLIYFSLFLILFYNWMKKPEFQKKDQFKKFYKNTMSDSLYKNSIYLMFNTLVMALSGFIFWMIATKLYSAESIGLATTLISVMGLITSISLLGLNTGLIRYLPTAENKNNKINTCFTLAVLVTIIITTIFLLGLKIFSPKLYFIKENLILSFVFILFMVFSSASSLTESIFIAYRNTKFVLVKNTIFSILKIALLPIFVSLTAYGLFTSWTLALTTGFIVIFIVLIYKHNYSPKLVFYDSVIKKIGRYSFGNYLAGIIGGLPTFLLPLIITNYLHPEITAYYYITMMIAALLFAIPQATANSLFAEGSYDENNLSPQIKKAVKIIFLLLIPSIIITILFGKYILLLFGKSYSSEGFMFLNILAVSGIFVAGNNIFSTLFRVKKKIKSIIFISFINAVVVLCLSYFWISMGLIGIGYAWLVGQFVTLFVYALITLLKTKS